MKVYPFDEVQRELLSYRLVHPNVHFQQQFNCSACKTKQTMEEEDKLFTRGTCEACHAVTDIVEAGCNYMLIISGGKLTPG